jgi:periplasmic protein TonB
MQPNADLPHRLIRALPLGLLALLAACSTPPPPAPAPPGGPVSGTPTPPPAGSPSPSAPAPGGVKASYATDPRSYRRDAAAHLYALNQGRVYTGKLPPLLYAIGVMQVELDARGQVRQFSWMRAPKHAPEVMAEIERTVRRAAPFPAPARLGKVTYTETWLWDKSGRFQLDTLTEGQRSEL